MKKMMIAALAVAGFGFSLNAMAADSAVQYVGSTAGGSAYGSAFSTENANANGGVGGGYSVNSSASQNMNGGYDQPSLLRNQCCSNVGTDFANTSTYSNGSIDGQIGRDSGVVSGYTGGESLASVANVGQTMTVATAEHHAVASMATSGANSNGYADNSGSASSVYNSLGNGSASTYAR